MSKKWWLLVPCVLIGAAYVGLVYLEKEVFGEATQSIGISPTQRSATLSLRGGGRVYLTDIDRGWLTDTMQVSLPMSVLLDGTNAALVADTEKIKLQAKLSIHYGLIPSAQFSHFTLVQGEDLEGEEPAVSLKGGQDLVMKSRFNWWSNQFVWGIETAKTSFEFRDGPWYTQFFRAEGLKASGLVVGSPFQWQLNDFKCAHCEVGIRDDEETSKQDGPPVYLNFIKLDKVKLVGGDQQMDIKAESLSWRQPEEYGQYVKTLDLGPWEVTLQAQGPQLGFVSSMKAIHITSLNTYYDVQRRIRAEALSAKGHVELVEDVGTLSSLGWLEGLANHIQGLVVDDMVVGTQTQTRLNVELAPNDKGGLSAQGRLDYEPGSFEVTVNEKPAYELWGLPLKEAWHGDIASDEQGLLGQPDTVVNEENKPQAP